MTISSAAVDQGSFRDRDGRVYHCQGRVFRGLSASALESFRRLQEESFYKKLTASGKVVASRELPGQENPLPESLIKEWAGFLEHKTVPIISYPYEWTFSMLKAAAGLQLHLVEQAISNGFTLKDATPYNIQFVDRKPVFIDIPSFEPLVEGEPWSGYRQFCEMFLFPLLLQAYKQCHFQPFMRASINGVDVHTAAGLFSFRDRFRKGVMTHVWLQSKLDRRFGGSSENVRSNLKSAGFNRELILVNVRKLQKLINKLEWQATGTEWADYAGFHNYSEQDHGLKEDFIRQAISLCKPATVWDIGCNTGQFSRVAASLCEQVVSTDIDHGAVERLFLDENTPSNILPLLQNIADPSPDWGWRNRERSELRSRSKPDLILCLALIHHVVITANIPLAEFIDWLASLTDKLVIEYVSRRDDKVKTLLRNKEDKYKDYSRESLQSNLLRHFEIQKQEDLNNGDRTLFLCSKPIAPVDSFDDHDNEYMAEALLLAQRAATEGEVPIGAVVVRDGEIIGRGWNRNIDLHDPSAHAEIMAMREAGETLGNHRLTDCTLYVTLEPCPMCAGAMIHARLERIVYGATDPKTGAAGGCFTLLKDPANNHLPVISNGCRADECSVLLKDFFRQRR